MTNEELIAEAYKRFPIGTKFVSRTDNGLVREVIPYDESATSMIYTIDQAGRVWVAGGMKVKGNSCSNPYLYQDGKWDEVISPVENYPIF